MSSARPSILLTGFGPFPRVSVNATSLLVPQLAEETARRFAGVDVNSAILPTEWATAPAQLAELYRRHRPTAAIHFGVSHRTSGFSVELRARNARSASPDAAGDLPPASCISAGGPDFLPCSLPAALIVERLRRRGIPAQLSRDAGAYLCNTLLYTALDHARRHGWPARAGFVHLPDSLIDGRRLLRGVPPSSRLTWSDAMVGGLDIISSALGRPHPPALRTPLRTPWPEWRASC